MQEPHFLLVHPSDVAFICLPFRDNSLRSLEGGGGFEPPLSACADRTHVLSASAHIQYGENRGRQLKILARPKSKNLSIHILCALLPRWSWPESNRHIRAALSMPEYIPLAAAGKAADHDRVARNPPGWGMQKATGRAFPVVTLCVRDSIHTPLAARLCRSINVLSAVPCVNYFLPRQPPGRYIACF